MTFRRFAFNRPARLLALLTLPCALLVSACEQSRDGTNAQGGQTPAAAAGPVTNPCKTVSLTLASALPTNTGNDQVSIDCAAWAAFIALNWRADPAKPGYPDPAATAANFGTPGDMSPTVWETYLEAGSVFNGGASVQGLWQAKRPGMKALSRTSKFGSLDLTDITQAGSGHHWLTNQRGDITYYEVMMNRDEYEFITTQKGFDLTTKAGQLACAMQPGKVVSDGPPQPGGLKRGGVTMPSGRAAGWSDTDCVGNHASYGDGVGAMEIKAAWTPLPADGSLNYRYKTASAQIKDPVSGQMRSVTVGLVGLHIIRKQIGRQQWIWSTFEHIDNTPDEGGPNGWTAPSFPANANQKPSPGYTFFNPSCDKAKDPAYACVHNAPPTRCSPTTPKCQPFNAPMQITRLNPVDDTANSVTAYVWSLLAAQAPQSVFNYYRLINVQWPQDSQILPAGQRVPLPAGNPTPPLAGNNPDPKKILANTTMESFQQASASCMDCHQFGQIVSPALLQASAPGGLRKLPVKAAAAPNQYGADYSFIFTSETNK